MALRIAYDADLPAEVRQAVEPYITAHAHRLPGWVYELRVGFDDNNQDANAWNRTNPEYRWARINVCAGFLTESAEDRNEIVLHELVHIPVQALVNAAWRLCEEVKEQSPAAERLAREAVRVAMEGAVTDVTCMLLDAIGERAP